MSAEGVAEALCVKPNLSRLEEEVVVVEEEEVGRRRRGVGADAGESFAVAANGIK